MITYEQARADHEYLWETYGPANDMTGGYVDQDDLRRLMQSPTKATARKCYVDQIEHWFSGGPEDDAPNGWQADPTVAEIASRHDRLDDYKRLTTRRDR